MNNQFNTTNTTNTINYKELYEQLLRKTGELEFINEEQETDIVVLENQIEDMIEAYAEKTSMLEEDLLIEQKLTEAMGNVIDNLKKQNETLKDKIEEMLFNGTYEVYNKDDYEELENDYKELREYYDKLNQYNDELIEDYNKLEKEYNHLQILINNYKKEDNMMKLIGTETTESLYLELEKDYNELLEDYNATEEERLDYVRENSELYEEIEQLNKEIEKLNGKNKKKK